jgi:hypothetical protein
VPVRRVASRDRATVRIEGVEFELAEYSTISTGEAVLAWANVSVEELIERGDAICARYSELEAPLRAALSKDDSPEAYERVGELLPQLGALLRQQIAELAELEPPTELTDDWAENLARLSRSADLLDAGGDAAAAHDRDRFVATATEARALELETAAFARRVGFKVCGSGVQSPSA